MFVGVDEHVRRLAPHLAPSLITPEFLACICSVAGLLPGPATRAFGFESRLADAKPDVDFLVHFSADHGRERLCSRESLRNIPLSSLWQKLRGFLVRWADPASPLHDTVSSIWMEFDLASPRGFSRAPNLFLEPADKILEAGSTEVFFRWFQGSTSAARQGISPKVEDCARRCLLTLPAGARLFHLGLMFPRPTEAVRLCLSRIPSQQIVDYLLEVGWRGEEEALRDLIGQLEPLTDRMTLGLAIGRGVLPRIGVECLFPNRLPGDPGGLSDWRHFLDFLGERQLCTVAKRDALLSFPCILRDPGGRTTLLLNNHVKISFEAGVLEAKAYFGALLSAM